MGAIIYGRVVEESPHWNHEEKAGRPGSGETSHGRRQVMEGAQDKNKHNPADTQQLNDPLQLLLLQSHLKFRALILKLLLPPGKQTAENVN